MTPVPDRLLDRALRRAAENCAQSGQLAFTGRQLYYETDRTLFPLHRGPHRLRYTTRPLLSAERFAAALARRPELDVLPDALPPAPHRPGPEGDLYDYAFPRLLVCQDPGIAGMLRANRLHLEGACPVLTPDRLPLDDRLLAAMERAEGAVVHVLHDASPAGLEFFLRVRAHAGSRLRVRTAGLLPRHAAALHLAALRGQPRCHVEELPAELPAAERAWLAGGRVAELAAVRPARLLRAVLRTVRGGGFAPPARPAAPTRARDTGFLTWPTP
ncbi:hypothetical protein HUT16_03575 [Kitasatospora sp. NA04385]|uniref:hypothetical protein n=1 Tax=Kitasatospora sp. NA04385 TaxID=2742135 RepID=UPI0015900F7A|nr:hypothetical protein [Kitasatospora sp. NA04385]QKW18265.1 hypothetical protein HUT16_03575 [Kitasatospora sp. NA04385]